jgi:hypothetical protein
MSGKLIYTYIHPYPAAKGKVSKSQPPDYIYHHRNIIDLYIHITSFLLLPVPAKPQLPFAITITTTISIIVIPV